MHQAFHNHYNNVYAKRNHLEDKTWKEVNCFFVSTQIVNRKEGGFSWIFLI